MHLCGAGAIHEAGSTAREGGAVAELLEEILAKKVLSLSLQQVAVDDDIIFYVFHRLNRHEHLVPVYPVALGLERIVRFDEQVDDLPGVEIDYDILDSPVEHTIITHHFLPGKKTAEGFGHIKSWGVCTI